MYSVLHFSLQTFYNLAVKFRYIPAGGRIYSPTLRAVVMSARYVLHTQYSTSKEFRDKIIFFFDVLLTVHLSIFISVINQLDVQNFCFAISLFHACTCFEQMCSSSGGQNCITQPLVSLTPIRGRLVHRFREDFLNLCTGRPPIGVMIPEAV